MYVAVGYVMKMTVKTSCNLGKYGWFEQLLFSLFTAAMLIDTIVLYFLYQWPCF